jgi:hypothetical protein
MKSQKLKQEADEAAVVLRKMIPADVAVTPDALRDFLDGWTQGDLDCIQLNILTDMVEVRLNRQHATLEDIGFPIPRETA